MIKIRKSKERGYFDHGWLKTYHTFSFGRYIDRAHMGFRCLRVINEDFVDPNQGFGKHPHDNMEIITYVISGKLKHEDSMGNGSIINAGDFQQMSAGTGVFHSEFNPANDEPVHLYQIWIEPDASGYEPSYDQKSFEHQKNALTLIACKNAIPSQIKINQDANLYFGQFDAKQSVTLPLIQSRYGWIQVISGEIELEGHKLVSGDGAQIEQTEQPKVNFLGNSKLIFFDLP